MRCPTRIGIAETITLTRRSGIYLVASPIHRSCSRQREATGDRALCNPDPQPVIPHANAKHGHDHMNA